jgi:prepilin-type processing-associated H-X9-DG protein
LSPTNYKTLICPSDDTASLRLNNPTPTSYPYAFPFSYQMNWALGATPYLSLVPAYLGGTAPAAPTPLYRGKITQIPDPSIKVLLIEGDDRRLVDGQSGVAEPVNFTNYTNLMSDRHDLTNRQKKDPAWGTGPQSIANSDGKGNAAFCDGHAEYVSRSYVHTWLHGFPDIPDDYPKWPLTTMANPTAQLP